VYSLRFAAVFDNNLFANTDIALRDRLRSFFVTPFPIHYSSRLSKLYNLRQSLLDQGHLIVEASRSHSRHNAVGRTPLDGWSARRR